ncbi:MAG TPA: serine hydrolase [bacterium]|nr:serine hydrolase [bacterium]
MITAPEQLASSLNDLCDAQLFETGWYLRDLRRGVSADRRGSVVVPSASTRKIAILMTALGEVEAGRLALDQRLAIEARYQISDSGCMQHFRPGSTLTLHDFLVMMIIVSDNVATGTVADLLGLDKINALCRSIGMVGTTHRAGIPQENYPLMPPGEVPPHDVNRLNATTPADVGRLLESILNGSDDPAAAKRLGVTPELCRYALDILSWQNLTARLPALLPTGTKVAHKTGTGGNAVNDAGIIFQNGRPLFILTVYTYPVPRVLRNGEPGKAAATGHIGRLSRTCWDALAQPE